MEMEREQARAIAALPGRGSRGRAAGLQLAMGSWPVAGMWEGAEEVGPTPWAVERSIGLDSMGARRTKERPERRSAARRGESCVGGGVGWGGVKGLAGCC